MANVFIASVGLGISKMCRFLKLHVYCETHKTVNTRNIYGMLLLCCEELANEARKLNRKGNGN